MLHSACTIHLLNLPEKTARRDIIHGVKHLEEIAEDWLCARRTLSILSVLARKWNCEVPDEAAAVLKRTDEKYGHLGTAEVPSPSGGAFSYTPSPPSFTAVSPVQPQPSISDDFLTTFDIPTPENTATTATRSSVANNNPWAMSGIGQPAMPRYYQPFTPISGPPQPSRHQRPSISPAQYNSLDGKDWFLKDSVNLQQNFESWGMGGGQSSNQAPVPPQTSSAAGRGAGGSGGDVFMFKGLQELEGMDLAGEGWDFDSSMTNLDMIPGLD